MIQLLKYDLIEKILVGINSVGALLGMHMPYLISN